MPNDREEQHESREGQEHPRALVLYPGTLRVGGWSVACEVVNISVEGANVRATQVLDLVPLLILSIAPHGEFECDVTWQDGEILGLTFREQGPKTRRLYEALLQDSEGAEGARDTTRVQVLWSGKLRSKEMSSDCRIVNVSLGGAKAQVSSPSYILSPVTLVIERFGEFNCEIVWREGDYLGLRFLDDRQTIEATIGRAVPQIRSNVN